jgi:hypothetical protein
MMTIWDLRFLIFDLGFPTNARPQPVIGLARSAGRDERLLVRAAFHAAAYERRTLNSERRSEKIPNS